MRQRRPNIQRLTRKHDVPRLVSALHYRDIWTDPLGRAYDLGAAVRRDAALALASMNQDDGDAEADIGRVLVDSLADPSDEVRRAVAAGLAMRAERRAIPALCELALPSQDSSNASSRPAAIQALEQMGGDEVVETLINLTVQRRFELTSARALLLRMIDRSDDETAQLAAVKAASAALSDGDRRVEGRAAAILTWFGARSVATLIDALRHMPPSVPAIRALGELRAIEATTSLVPLLRHADAEVREGAAAALGPIADLRAAKALAAATSDPDIAVREAAVEAASRLVPAATLIEFAHAADVDRAVSHDAASYVPNGRLESHPEQLDWAEPQPNDSKPR